MFTTTIVGNVVKKSGLRIVTTERGDTAVIDLRLAARNGGKKVHFVKVVVWGNDAKAVDQYLEIGRTVAVEGLPKAQTWTDPQGNQRVWLEVHTTYVEFLNHGRGEQPGGEQETAEEEAEEIPF